MKQKKAVRQTDEDLPKELEILSKQKPKQLILLQKNKNN